jgi:UDP-N-acetylmuramate dehydrogenase
MSMWPEFDTICQENAPLAPLTWFRLGGSARLLARVRCAEQLDRVLERARQDAVPVYVLGDGANVLVRDDGVDGVVIRLAGGDYEQIEWKDAGVIAGGGKDIARLTLDAVRRGLGGLERLAGVPGTVGGCIRMNAGGRFGEIGELVRRVWTVESNGRRREWNHDQLKFGYRRCALADEIIERAEFTLTPSDPGSLMKRYRAVWAHKKKSQPLGADSAGCIFKNPPGDYAGALIERVGLKGASVGGASVSTEHANFIVAGPDAKADDVVDLIDLVRRRVRQSLGVELELEVKIWPPDAVCQCS